MKKLSPLSILLLTLIFLSAILVYGKWFRNGVITFGDWKYLTREQMVSYYPLPSFWRGENNLGMTDVPSAPQLPINALYGLAAKLGFSFSFVEKLLFFFPYVVFVYLFPGLLSYKIWKKYEAAFASSLFFPLTTYSLFIAGGGHLTIGVAFALMPGIIWAFLKLIDKFSFKIFALASILLAISVTYEARITFLTEIILFGISLLYLCRKVIKPFQYFIALAVVVAFIHSFWILPIVVTRSGTLPQRYFSVEAARNLSFIKTSHSLALSHPLYPKNTFGYPQPVLPATLFLPFIIFFPLTQKLKKSVLLSYVGALVGVFLTKGTNPPFGIIYELLFQYFPGFKYFRDSSKFYSITNVFYALLFGLAVFALYRKYLTENRRLFKNGLLAAIVLALFLAVYPTWYVINGNLKGTFNLKNIPANYAEFNQFVEHQDEQFKILYLPTKPRWIVTTPTHPAIDGATLAQEPFLTDQSQFYGNSFYYLGSPGFINLLRSLNVKYVVLSDPSEEEAYKDYGSKDELLSLLARNNLTVSKSISGIDIFEVPNYRSHQREFQPVYGVENSGYVLSGLAFSENFTLPTYNRQPDISPLKQLGRNIDSAYWTEPSSLPVLTSTYAMPEQDGTIFANVPAWAKKYFDVERLFSEIASDTGSQHLQTQKEELNDTDWYKFEVTNTETNAISIPLDASVNLFKSEYFKIPNSGLLDSEAMIPAQNFDSTGVYDLKMSIKTNGDKRPVRISFVYGDIKKALVGIKENKNKKPTTVRDRNSAFLFTQTDIVASEKDEDLSFTLRPEILTNKFNLFISGANQGGGDIIISNIYLRRVFDLPIVLSKNDFLVNGNEKLTTLSFGYDKNWRINGNPPSAKLAGAISAWEPSVYQPVFIPDKYRNLGLWISTLTLVLLLLSALTVKNKDEKLS